MTYKNTITALLAIVIPACLSKQIQEWRIRDWNRVFKVRQNAFSLDNAIILYWKGDYDPSNPNAHLRVEDSQLEPKPYTVTSVDVCEGPDFIPNCKWSWLIRLNDLDFNEGYNSYRLNIVESNGDNR